MVFGYCTSTTQRASAERRRFGSLLANAGLDVLYLLDTPLANTTVKSGFPNGSRVQTSSQCPPQLKVWANPGERCAWTQTVDLFTAFPEADWYALGDDDTLWIFQNLLQTLSTFSPQSRVFLGGLGNDEELQVSKDFWAGRTDISADMVFGGAGMILSHAVMAELQGGMLDCLAGMRHLHGGDERISLCVRNISNIGPHVLPGFHQLDYFDPTHLFHLHPRSPVLALHHLLEPTVFDAIEHRGLTLDKLEEGIAADPFSFLQGRKCATGPDTFLVAPGFQVFWFKHGVAYSMLMYSQMSRTKAGSIWYYQGGQGRGAQEVVVHEDWHAFSWAHDRPQYCCKVTSLKARPRQAVLRIKVANNIDDCDVSFADQFDSAQMLLHHRS